MSKSKPKKIKKVTLRLGKSGWSDNSGFIWIRVYDAEIDKANERQSSQAVN